jgi:hypothetical protein
MCEREIVVRLLARTEFFLLATFPIRFWDEPWRISSWYRRGAGRGGYPRRGKSVRTWTCPFTCILYPTCYCGIVLNKTRKNLRPSTFTVQQENELYTEIRISSVFGPILGKIKSQNQRHFWRTAFCSVKNFSEEVSQKTSNRRSTIKIGHWWGNSVVLRSRGRGF